MKKCPSCGFECEDHVKFCTECGASFPEQPDFFVSPSPAPAASGRRGFLKELSGSKLAMILVITFTLALIGSIFCAAYVPKTLGKYAEEVMPYVEEYLPEILEELPPEIANSIDISTGDVKTGISVNFGRAISGRLFPVVVAIALWVVFITAKKPGEPCCNATGFKIVRVMKIIELIGKILGIVILTLLAVVAAAVMDEYGLDDYEVIPYSILGFFIVIFLFDLFYCTGTIRTLKTLICVAEDRACKMRVSGYAAFIYFVRGIFAMIGGISIAANTGKESFLLLAGFTAIVSGISYFSVGKYIKKCKQLKKM